MRNRAQQFTCVLQTFDIVSFVQSVTRASFLQPPDQKIQRYGRKYEYAGFKKAFRGLGWKGKFGRLGTAVQNEARTFFVLINPAVRPEQDFTVIFVNEAVWQRRFHDIASEVGGHNQTLLLKTMAARMRPLFGVVDASRFKHATG